MTNEIKKGFYEDENGDLKYISANGIHYDLLEGTTIAVLVPNRTSDIVFILTDEIDFDNMLESRFVGSMYGATFLLDPNEERRNEFRGYVEAIINEFEEDHDNWVNQVKKARA